MNHSIASKDRLRRVVTCWCTSHRSPWLSKKTSENEKITKHTQKHTRKERKITNRSRRRPPGSYSDRHRQTNLSGKVPPSDFSYGHDCLAGVYVRGQQDLPGAVGVHLSGERGLAPERGSDGYVHGCAGRWQRGNSSVQSCFRWSTLQDGVVGEAHGKVGARRRGGRLDGTVVGGLVALVGLMVRQTERVGLEKALSSNTFAQQPAQGCFSREKRGE